MRKIKFLLFILVLCTINNSHAQEGNYLSLDFQGKNASNNSPVSLEKVVIVNLTRGAETTISEPPFSINLEMFLTGVESHFDDSQQGMHVTQTYPNPFQNEMTFDLKTIGYSNIQMTLYNLNGEKLGYYADHIEEGIHRFRLQSSRNGVLFLHITDGKSREVLKLINTGGANNGQSFISYNGQNTGVFHAEEETPVTRSTEVITAKPFSYVLGDQLQIIGYANGYANSTIYDSPTTDNTYTFTFSRPYYLIAGHEVSTSLPSFVDILFTVSDATGRGVDNLGNADFVVKENDKPTSPTETFPYIRKMNTVPFKIQTILMLDNSASLSETDRERVKTAAVKMIENKDDKQEIAIYCFSGDPELLQDFTTDQFSLINAINSIEEGDVSTNLYGSCIEGVNRITNFASKDMIQQGYLVMFTDGNETQNTYTLEQAVNARGNKNVYMIGLGNELDAEALNQLANPGSYLSITQAGQLDQVFMQIQQDIIRYANSFYLLNYMSPTRSGQHTLRLEIKNNENYGENSTYTQYFSANGFIGNAPRGVYLNAFVGENPIDGLAESYVIDNFTSSTFDMQAVTYRANHPPSYTWSSSDDRIAKVVADPVYFNKATIVFPEVNPGGQVTITVKDEANNYGRSVQARAITPPVVTTNAVTEITYTSAVSGGKITNDGGLPVTQKGVCWSTRPGETDNMTYQGGGTDEFVSNIDLRPGITYYIRAYATNAKGTGYGKEITFKTKDAVAPSLTTTEISNINETTAYSGGEITETCGLNVTERGICWSTSPNPTTEDSKNRSSSWSNQFSCQLSNLSPYTTYYVRSYAVNEKGTGYGNEINFKTLMSLPSVIASPAINITPSSATLGGKITGEGAPSYTERGFCYSTNSNPTIDDSKVVAEKTEVAEFTVDIDGLTTGTKYYFKAYAVNEKGVVYSSQLDFTANALPVVTTLSDVSNIRENSATVYGNIEIVGVPAYTEKGLCYSTNQNPTINDLKKVSGGTGTGNFGISLNALEQATTYYVRAYAINSLGTAYGNEISFTTLGPPTVSTTPVSDITANSAISGGEVISDGGYPITQKGVCWNTSPNPTTNNTKTVQGTGNEVFNSNIINLQPLTTYYVRAYATNYRGTSYGEEQSFTTLPVLPQIHIYDVNTDYIHPDKATLKGQIGNRGIPAYSERGFCYSTTSSMPTVDDTKIIIPGNDYNDFQTTLDNLLTGETYYVRLYVIQNDHAIYSEVKSFFRKEPVSIQINSYEMTSLNTIKVEGTILNAGKPSYTECGIICSESSSFTNPDNITVTPNTNKNFSCDITNLAPETVYYIKAYARSGDIQWESEAMTFKTYYSTVSDIDGNIYFTVRIGNQEWMAQNLRATKTRDGNVIAHVTENAPWSNLTAKYCWYMNNEAKYKNQGAIYSRTVATQDLICPTGWHVPTSTDINNMHIYLSQNYRTVKPDKLITTSVWNGSSTKAGTIGSSDQPEYRNLTGLSIHPSGYRLWVSETNSYIFSDESEIIAYLWTRESKLWRFLPDIEYSTPLYSSSQNGHNIRCIRN